MTEAEARWIALAAWYRGAGRTLPWRDSSDPWVILVSEVMLQQTQVVRVVERLEPFLARFPAPGSMAAASRQDVLAAWSGLGYNRRAVRLHDAARLIAADGWPTNSTDLRRLPGVGAYTAAAVACFAFGEQVPAIDINVRRVLSRWMKRVLTVREATQLAADLLPADEAHHWVQSIMDLGATTCTAQDPACVRCPCEPWCSGADITVSSRPQPAFKGSMREARGAVLRVLARQGTIGLPELAEATGIDSERLMAAARALADEGTVEVIHDRLLVREALDTGGSGR